MEANVALTGRQKRHLRALAQPQRPLVRVGDAGVSAGVIGAVSAALLEHELVKVRFHEPEDKHASAEALAAACDAALCGVVGHTAILYRPHPERPRIQLPRAASEDR